MANIFYNTFCLKITNETIILTTFRVSVAHSPNQAKGKFEGPFGRILVKIIMACEALKRKKQRQKMIKQKYTEICFKWNHLSP